jgi:hypothetical protein
VRAGAKPGILCVVKGAFDTLPAASGVLAVVGLLGAIVAFMYHGTPRWNVSSATRRKLTVALAVYVWLALALWGLTAYAMTEQFDSAACPHPTIEYGPPGELTWSALPPGPVCTWRNPDGSSTREGPGYGMTAWIVAVVVGAYVVTRMIRRGPGDAASAEATAAAYPPA